MITDRLNFPRKRLSLGAELAERIAGEIRSGAIAAGEKLPTEQELIQSSGVSRAVVREALVALKAQGLVDPRQGVGVFVRSSFENHTFQLEPEGLGELSAVLEVLELRMVVEGEAVALAALRRTPQQMQAVWDAHREFEGLTERGDSSVAADFRFHCALAEATGNRYFVKLTEFLGPLVIPRQTVQVQFQSPDEQIQYLRMLQEEHLRIVQAVDQQDPNAAREAMRIHLVDGRERYRKLREQQEQAK
jgi:GntR family transcriptional repressor for pyruvate dehydrogenase complex